MLFVLGTKNGRREDLSVNGELMLNSAGEGLFGELLIPPEKAHFCGLGQKLPFPKVIPCRLLGATEEVAMETHKEEMELLSNSMAAYAHIRGGCVSMGVCGSLGGPPGRVDGPGVDRLDCTSVHWLPLPFHETLPRVSQGAASRPLSSCICDFRPYDRHPEWPLMLSCKVWKVFMS